MYKTKFSNLHEKVMHYQLFVPNGSLKKKKDGLALFMGPSSMYKSAQHQQPSRCMCTLQISQKISLLWKTNMLQESTSPFWSILCIKNAILLSTLHVQIGGTTWKNHQIALIRACLSA